MKVDPAAQKILHFSETPNFDLYSQHPTNEHITSPFNPVQVKPCFNITLRPKPTALGICRPSHNLIWSSWQYLDTKYGTTDLITEKELSQVNMLIPYPPHPQHIFFLEQPPSMLTVGMTEIA